MKKKEAPAKPRAKKAASSSTTVKKRAPRAKKPAFALESAPLAATPAPRIDYPQEAERITSAIYTLRIDAPQDGLLAEVSIDGGGWNSCRAAVGFWWFDWSGFGPGEHELVVRLVGPEGQASLSSSRRCVVEL